MAAAAGGAHSAAAAPASVEDELAELSAREHAKRQTLEQLMNQRETVQVRAMDLQDRVLQKHGQLRKRERLLSAQAGQLLQALKTEEMRVNKLSSCVHRIQKQRKQLLQRITEPGWAIPHHYHMTAVEHAMGHAQPHVLDVGSMIKGHLAIFAMANATVRFQKNASHVLGKARTGRVKVSEQIKKVYRQLRVVRAEMKNIEKILDALKDRVGAPQKRSRTQQQMLEKFRQSRAATPAPPTEPLIASEAATEDRDDDLHVATSVADTEDADDLQLMSAVGRARSPSTSSAPGSLFVSTPRPIAPPLPPQLPRSAPASPGSPPGSSSGGAPAGGYRNIKMRFFQALNLTPPALSDAKSAENDEDDDADGGAEQMMSASSASSQSGGRGAAGAGGKDRAARDKPGPATAVGRGKAAPPTPVRVQEDVNALEWRELSNLMLEIEPLDNAKQAAWEELEAVLDRRERLKYDLEHRDQAAGTGGPAAEAAAPPLPETDRLAGAPGGSGRAQPSRPKS
jgi:hypothetical protein